MFFYLILFAVSFVGLSIFLLLGFPRLKNFSEGEILTRYKELSPFWNDFHALFVARVIKVHQEKVRPAAYKEIEKLTRRFRIIVLRVECLLLRFSEYIRGKRKIQSNGHKSRYWEQLNNCKNGANGSTKKNNL